MRQRCRTGYYNALLRPDSEILQLITRRDRRLILLRRRGRGAVAGAEIDALDRLDGMLKGAARRLAPGVQIDSSRRATSLKPDRPPLAGLEVGRPHAEQRGPRGARADQLDVERLGCVPVDENVERDVERLHRRREQPPRAREVSRVAVFELN